ncbi:MAG TPA: ATP-binding protein [Clostridia bacterium]|nr:ATP-binding protein [Clostridia bacterium]
MRKKLVFKLTFYFTIVLLILSIGIGIVFTILFRNHTVDLYKRNLVNSAVGVSETLSEFTFRMQYSRFPLFDFPNRNNFYFSNDAQVYISFLNSITMANVWIIDRDYNFITTGTSYYDGSRVYTFSELPHNAEKVIQKVFEGETTFSEVFGNFFETPTLTVGVPIVSQNGEVIGVVLLHSPIDYMQKAIEQGIKTLVISILLALVLSVILSFSFAWAFTKPMDKIRNVTLELAKGNYEVKTDVSQDDEIGDVAKAVDILSERLNEASREREKLDKMRKDFVANISHELRTPVTVIRGSVEALHDKVVTEPKQVEEYFSHLLAESIYLQRLVNDLLDLSRLQNADFSLNKEEVNLLSIVHESVRSARRLCTEKDISINFESDMDVEVINGDFDRLRQMILIILDNAIKFSSTGSTIDITYRNFILSITDHGEGIREEDLPYIFDRFYKMRDEKNKEGTGLGLAIAKQIALRHDIAVTVDSKENEYTTFSFDFSNIVSYK